MDSNAQVKEGQEEVIAELSIGYAPVIRPFLTRLDSAVKGFWVKIAIDILIKVCDKLFNYTPPTA